MLIDILFLIINLFLYKRTFDILVYLQDKEANEDARKLKSFNLILIVLSAISVFTILFNFTFIYEIINKIMIIVFIFYVSLILSEILEYFIRKQKSRVDDNGILRDTYQTKITNLIMKSILFLITVIISIKYLGYNSLLSSTGVLGVLLAMMAFTSKIWAQDVLDGLILLENEVIEPGDLIKLNDKEYLVSKFGFFEMELIDVASNHKLIVKNTNIRNGIVENLTKTFDDTGFRKEVVYAFGYKSNIPMEEYVKRFKKLEKLLTKSLKADKRVKFMDNDEDVEVLFYAIKPHYVEVEISFYLKNFANLETTNDAREYFSDTTRYLHEHVLINSSKVNLSTEIIKKEVKLEERLSPEEISEIIPK